MDKRVFDSETGRSIGFERGLRLAAENELITLGESDAGTLRVIDAMRDDEPRRLTIVADLADPLRIGWLTDPAGAITAAGFEITAVRRLRFPEHRFTQPSIPHVLGSARMR